jgi:regulator of sigma E protease
MEFIGSVWSYVVPFIVVITVIVFFHELGHYLFARLNGVRVEVFSIGFGRELFGWNDRHGTRWKVAMLPLGGYVKMFGQSDLGPDGQGADDWTDEQKAEAFPNKTVMQRFWVVLGGPLANFILAIVLFAGVFAFVGRSETLPEASTVVENSAAERAGIEPGDLIVAIDGKTIERFDDLQYVISLSPGRPLNVELLRNGETIVLQVTPDSVTETDDMGNERQVGRLGISTTSVVYEKVPLGEALWGGVEETLRWTTRIFDFLGQVISGRQSSKDLAGPLGIAQMSGTVAEYGVASLVMFMAILSVNLGLINLFPIPMLDGGHLLFYIIEAVRGRPLSERAQEYGFMVGIGLVGVLFLFVTFNDLSRFGLVDFLTRLVS